MSGIIPVEIINGEGNPVAFVEFSDHGPTIEMKIYSDSTRENLVADAAPYQKTGLKDKATLERISARIVTKCEMDAIDRTFVAEQVGFIDRYYEAPVKPEKQTTKEGKATQKAHVSNEDKMKVVDCANVVMMKTPTVAMRDSLEFYMYNRGVYENVGPRKNALPLKKVIRETHAEYCGGKECTSNFVSQVLSYIEDRHHISRNAMNTNPRKIAVRNGILDVLTGELTPHTPDELLTVMVDVQYDPAAECPEFDDFLHSLFLAEGGRSIGDQVQLIYEYIGYCLYMDYPYEATMMFIGEGGNGKGTLIRIMSEFLGADNVAGMSLEQIGDQETHPFRLAGLYGRLANLCGDMGNRAIKNTEGYKKATGRDWIDVDVKFGAPFKFMNHAKMVFSVNEMPETYDNSMGFYDRWLFLKFPRRFRKSTNSDPFIADKCMTDAEKSGILNAAIAGLKRLMENKEFTGSNTTDDIRTQWTALSDPVSLFIEAQVEPSENESVFKDSVYEIYINYCEEHKIPKMHADQFKKAFPKKCRAVGHSVTTTKAMHPVLKSRLNCYKGIAVTPVERRQVDFSGEAGRDIALFVRDLMNFVNTHYPTGVDVDVGIVAERFGTRFPGHREEFGLEYIHEMTEKQIACGEITYIQ